jgi:hypothetical protein
MVNYAQAGTDVFFGFNIRHKLIVHRFPTGGDKSRDEIRHGKGESKRSST